MDDGFRVGRMLTIFAYILEGVVALFVALWARDFSSSFIFSAIIGWITGLLFLLAIPIANNKFKSIYVVSEIILISAMNVWLISTFDNYYILFLMFCFQWTCNMLFWQTFVPSTVLIVQSITMIALTFGYGKYRYTEFVVTMVLLISNRIFFQFANRFIVKQMQSNKDNRRSLDDMLKLVDEKYLEARLANDSKSSFLANMSHEIRTPINTILGLDTMILRESKEKEVRQYAYNIHSAGQSLLSLINDILDFSKIESGKMEILPEEYDFSSLINDVINMIKPRVQSKKLDFIIDVNPALPARLYGDETRLRQVLINLLTNAAKYTNKGSITLSISGDTEGDLIRLNFAVKDTGIGIKEENLSMLFEEFVRIEESRNRGIEGTGLGINIVTSLLGLMGSKLEVESEYNKGSNFHFMLIQGVCSQECIGNIESRIQKKVDEYAYENPYTLPDVRFLVVDDNTMNRLVFKGLVKSFECMVDEADSGLKCIELATKNKYDIIFLDHMMPGMDGVETLHELHSIKDCINSETPIIALTANAIAGSREQYMSEGFDGYLSKPIDVSKLEKVIDRTIPEAKKITGRNSEGQESDNATNQGKANETKKKARTAPESSETLPSVDGADWDYALLKLKKVKMLEVAVTQFILSSNKDIQELRNLYNTLKDSDMSDGEVFKPFRIKVHAMKSSSAMIGAMGVSSLAKILEFAARDNDINTIERVMDVFDKEWNAFAERLKDSFDKE